MINPPVKSAIVITSGQAKMQVQMSWTTQTCLDVQGFLFQSTQGAQLAYTFFCTTFFCPPDFCIQMGTALAQASRATAPC